MCFSCCYFNLMFGLHCAECLFVQSFTFSTFICVSVFTLNLLTRVRTSKILWHHHRVHELHFLINEKYLYIHSYIFLCVENFNRHRLLFRPVEVRGSWINSPNPATLSVPYCIVGIWNSDRIFSRALLSSSTEISEKWMEMNVSKSKWPLTCLIHFVYPAGPTCGKYKTVNSLGSFLSLQPPMNQGIFVIAHYIA